MTDAAQPRNAASRVSAWAVAGTTHDGFAVRMEGLFSWEPDAVLPGEASLRHRQRTLRRVAQTAVVEHVARITLSALLSAIDGIELRPEPSPHDARIVQSLRDIRILSVRLPSAGRQHNEASTLLALSGSLDRFRVLGRHLNQESLRHTAT